MNYIHISSSSLELLPTLSTASRAPAALLVKAPAKRSPETRRSVRYPVIEFAETALYLCLAVGFVVAAYGFISMFHL